MIPFSVDIDAFFVTSYFIIFFDHHPIPQLGEYIMHLKCFLFWQFPLNFFRSVCQGVDGQRKCCQKHRICSLLVVFTWHVCTILFWESGWWLRCGPVTSTRIILFQMPPLLMLWCYIMLCQKIMKQNNLFVIYNSPISQYLVVYFYSKYSQKW